MKKDVAAAGAAGDAARLAVAPDDLSDSATNGIARLCFHLGGKARSRAILRVQPVAREQDSSDRLSLYCSLAAGARSFCQEVTTP